MNMNDLGLLGWMRTANMVLSIYGFTVKFIAGIIIVAVLKTTGIQLDWDLDMNVITFKPIGPKEKLENMAKLAKGENGLSFKEILYDVFSEAKGLLFTLNCAPDFFLTEEEAMKIKTELMKVK